MSTGVEFVPDEPVGELGAEGGELVVTSYDGRDAFELEISDSGPGLSEDQAKRVFDPFFTTKSTGTGLLTFSIAQWQM